MHGAGRGVNKQRMHGARGGGNKQRMHREQRMHGGGQWMHGGGGAEDAQKETKLIG